MQTHDHWTIGLPSGEPPQGRHDAGTSPWPIMQEGAQVERTAREVCLGEAFGDYQKK